MRNDTHHMHKRGAALLTVLILIFILSILAGVLLTLLSSEAKLVSHGIFRSEMRHFTESGMVRQIELLRRGLGVESGPLDIDFDGINDIDTIGYCATTGELCLTTRDFSLPF